jgi:hypothetical protein
LRLRWRWLRGRYHSGLYIRSGRAAGANQINLAKGAEGGFIGGKVSGAKAVPELQRTAGQRNEWRVLARGDRLTLWGDGRKGWEATGGRA